MKIESGREGCSSGDREGVSMRFENSLWYHSESESESICSRFKLSLSALRWLKQGGGRVKSTSESGERGISDERGLEDKSDVGR